MLLPPIHPKIKQSEKKNQNDTLYIDLNAELLIFDFTKNGNAIKTNIEANNNTTPPNLLGTERNIA